MATGMQGFFLMYIAISIIHTAQLRGPDDRQSLQSRKPLFLVALGNSNSGITRQLSSFNTPRKGLHWRRLHRAQAARARNVIHELRRCFYVRKSKSHNAPQPEV